MFSQEAGHLPIFFVSNYGPEKVWEKWLERALNIDPSISAMTNVGTKHPVEDFRISFKAAWEVSPNGGELKDLKETLEELPYKNCAKVACS